MPGVIWDFTDHLAQPQGDIKMQWTNRLWRTVAVLIALLSVGCATEVAPAPDSAPPRVNRIEALSVSGAQERLKEILLRSVNPQIREVDVTDSFFKYSYAEVIMVPTGRMVTNQVAFANAVEVRVHSNNLVQILTSTKLVIAQFVFGNSEDAMMFADLIRSFYRKTRST